MSLTPNPYLVAVIGAGPAGLFAARLLAANGARVLLFNRDIKIGGLAEYGIYHDKYKMKEGLRKQFRQIIQNPDIEYYGNVKVGKEENLTLEALQALGVQATLVAIGAQGTKKLGLPGEDLIEVYHAKDLVFHYNQLPPFSTQYFPIRCRVALIGVGNVMLDIAHWMIRELKVDEVTAIARRGPAQVKFTRKELEIVAANLDLPDLEAEFAHVAPQMQALGQDVQTAKDYILGALPKALPPVSDTHFRLRFLASPVCIQGDEDGHVIGIELEDNQLVQQDRRLRAVGLGTTHLLDADMVVFCIGDSVDARLGLPVLGYEYVKHPRPLYPVDGHSYEAYNPRARQAIPGLFLAGWSREASSGLVGVARKDGENGASAMLKYLKTQSPAPDHAPALSGIKRLLRQTGQPVVGKDDLKRLDEIEQAEAQRLGLPEYRMKTDHDMLSALGLAW